MNAKASRYRRVSVSMWGDAKFRRLSPPQPCGQFLWLYLLTGPHTTNIPGCIPTKPEALAAQLGWSAKAFREAFGEAFAEGMLKVDSEAGLVWLPKAPEHNKPESPNVVRSWRSTWDLLPECPLKDEIWRSLKAFAEGWGEGFAKAFREACRQPSPNQDQDQDQEQDLSDTQTALALTGEVRSPLGRHQVVCGRLWALQEELRREAIPGSRSLTATDERLSRIAERLEAGATEADCEHVLRVRAAEARRDPQSAKFFNGVTNWRADAFEFALSQPLARQGAPSRARNLTAAEARALAEPS